MRAPQAYLAAYNILQGLGWAYCLGALAVGLAHGEAPLQLYGRTGAAVREWRTGEMAEKGEGVGMPCVPRHASR